MLKKIVIPQRVPKSMNNMHMALSGLEKVECQQYRAEKIEKVFFWSSPKGKNPYFFSNSPSYSL
jgi:hypothetical protein